MKQIKCGLCDYMCSNYNPDLKLHMKRQHQLDGDLTCRESLACEQCNFVVSMAAVLIRNKEKEYVYSKWRKRSILRM